MLLMGALSVDLPAPSRTAFLTSVDGSTKASYKMSSFSVLLKVAVLQGHRRCARSSAAVLKIFQQFLHRPAFAPNGTLDRISNEDIADSVTSKPWIGSARWRLCGIRVEKAKFTLKRQLYSHQG